MRGDPPQKDRSAQIEQEMWSRDKTQRAHTSSSVSTGIAAHEAAADPHTGYLLAASNLSDVLVAETARTNLGLQIGVNVQAWENDLDLLAAVNTNPYGRSLLTTTSEANFKALVNLEAGVDYQAFNVEYTAANIADIAHAVNTTGKRLGLLVWDTTNNRMMRARGATAGALWDVVDGSASVTPV